METFSFTVYLFLLFTQIRKDLISVHARHITPEPQDGQRDFLKDCEATSRMISPGDAQALDDRIAQNQLCGVEMCRGGLGSAYLLPALSSAGASLSGPCSVSASRSSNRTGLFQASGSRRKFHQVAHGKLLVRLVQLN
jgi:hypothetical protein